MARVDYGANTLKGLANQGDPRMKLIASRKTEDLDSGEIIFEETFTDDEAPRELPLPSQRPGDKPGENKDKDYDLICINGCCPRGEDFGKENRRVQQTTTGILLF